MPTNRFQALLLGCAAFACAPAPIDGFTDSELCGTADASFDISPAPLNVRTSGGTFSAPTTISTSGNVLSGTLSDLLEDLGWQSAKKASFNLYFEGPSVLSEIQKRCGVTLPTNTGSYALIVHPSGAMVAGVPTGQAFALATLRQLLSGGKFPSVSVLDGPAVPSRFVLEGFYGEPFTWPQRADMARLAVQRKIDTYVYAPKDDFLSAILWATPYDAATLADFQTFAAYTEARGVRLCTFIAPGGNIIYSDVGQRTAMEQKFQQLMSVGINCFYLGYDDIPMTLTATDRAAYPSYAAAQLDFTTFIANWMKTQPSHPQLIGITGNIYSTVSFLSNPSYVATISTLDPSIIIGWTGMDVVSPEVTAADVSQAAGLLHRAPALGDNYPVAATGAGMGPLNLLPMDLRDPVGMVALSAYGGNTMIQERASIVALASEAELGWTPFAYDPIRAFDHGVRAAAGSDSSALLFFAQHAEGLNQKGLDSAPWLRNLLDSYSPDPNGNEPLAQHFAQMANIGSQLASINPEMLTEIQPWVSKMQAWGAFGGDLLAACRLPHGTVPADTLTSLNQQLATIEAMPAVMADAPIEAFAQQQIAGF